ncbi:unnamed protein product [marine sediment metagenome]|uniref:Uncharacterized protein n=1 Tax=marine sediment metagenome TaxID=412755 RepID=X1TIN0_9ZZZZ
MGALAEYVEKRWGVPSHSIENPVTPDARAGITQILLNNPDRFEAIVVNYDDKLMRLAPSRDVSAIHGIPLEPEGGFAVITADDDGESVGYEWFIWSELGNDAVIYVLETEAS